MTRISDLPKKLKNLAISYQLEDMEKFNLPTEPCEYQSLSLAFPWEDTAEGYDFWNEVYDKYYKTK